MSGHNQFALLKTRRFLPLFVTQALSAFNDNAFRFAVASILLASLGSEQAEQVNTISAALFVLPYLLFSATAGQLSDKYDKARVARWVKLVEIGIVALSVYALYSPSIALKQFCIFLAGTQAAFFGPMKYSILPQHLTKDELLGGNGMVEMATFLSVLLGTIFGNLIVEYESGRGAISVIMIGIAIFSYWTSTQIPPAPSTQPELKAELEPHHRDLGQHETRGHEEGSASGHSRHFMVLAHRHCAGLANAGLQCPEPQGAACHGIGWCSVCFPSASPQDRSIATACSVAASRSNTCRFPP